MATMLNVDDGSMRAVELTEIPESHHSILTCAAATVRVTVEDAGGITRVGVAVDCGLVVSQMTGETKMRLRTAFFTTVPG
jgi:hypothetical protein